MHIELKFCKFKLLGKLIVQQNLILIMNEKFNFFL